MKSYTPDSVFAHAHLAFARWSSVAPVMATGMVMDAVKAVQDEKKQEGEEPVLQLKDFVWDQFLKYISSAILALTVLNVSVEFLRGGGVLCFPPPLTKSVD